MGAIILKAAPHHIPSGRYRFNTEPVPTKILEKMRSRDDFRSRDSISPALQEMNGEITRLTNELKRQKSRQFVETLYHKTVPTKGKVMDGKSTPKAENEAITFNDSQVSSPKQIATISTDRSPLQSWANIRKEMKEALFTRHNQTVLPLLANTEKD